LRRANHSSRGILPTVVRRRVCSRYLVNEEALAQWGLLPPLPPKKNRRERQREPERVLATDGLFFRWVSATLSVTYPGGTVFGFKASRDVSVGMIMTDILTASNVFSPFEMLASAEHVLRTADGGTWYRVSGAMRVCVTDSSSN